ncbi:branched-chain amino acid transport system ATP-binding protein [Amorphus suaedae]
MSILTLERLNAYYGKAHILSDVSLSIAKGSIGVILGRNGAGKTTTLRSVMGLMAQKSGRIVFDGHDISRLRPFEICRRGLGFVPEDRRIFTDLTVEENLKVGAPRGRMTAGWSPERIYTVFPNLAEMRNRRANQMSGGEQQMLTLARTLMGAPKMMLVDEPSEGLAPVIVQQMAGMLKSLRDEGVTILLSEQNMFFAAEVATHAFIIEKGEIRFDGPIRAVLDDEALRAAYLAV